MKKIMFTALIGVISAATLQAQEIPDRKRGEFRPHEKHLEFRKKQMADLNLSEEQKAKIKELNKAHREKFEALRKQDNITVKESREKMEALRKEHHDKIQSVFTPEQKAQLEKNKTDRQARIKEMGEKRVTRMKEQLNLTEAQSAKLAENRKLMADKMKDIREDNTLSMEQKREKIKELMKAQKEELKKLLTEDQLEKLKEKRKEHGKRKKI